MSDTTNFDAIVIGGGFYGARIALMLRAAGASVVLVEREPELLWRASIRNQARVHQGYHYPRSMLTSLRARRNYARFVTEYADCVHRSFPHYYAIARGTSRTTAAQFVQFCRRIGAPAEPAPQAVSRLFDSSRIEVVLSVEECAFDAVKLRARVTRELADAGVGVRLGAEAVRITAAGDGNPRVTLRERDETYDLSAPLILNCTYSRINHVLTQSGAAAIPVKHELTELALVEPPPELEGGAVTVMDGPFFSLMPYPSTDLFTLSHVRYTPHCAWHDQANGAPITDGDASLSGAKSRVLHMVRDAERYLPVMRAARSRGSIWEVKTVMPRSEHDDSRPILLRRSPELPGVVTMLGAKIDSVYDVEDELKAMLEVGQATRDTLDATRDTRDATRDTRHATRDITIGALAGARTR